jgi:pimeloyl-ACP methyl ester carboxylesterase
MGAGYTLRRDLYFRDNFKRALDTGQSAPVPAFFWPMLSELTVPILVIRATESDMFGRETLSKVRASNPSITAIELEGSHDLANDNPEGLVAAIREFLLCNHL